MDANVLGIIHGLMACQQLTCSQANSWFLVLKQQWNLAFNKIAEPFRGNRHHHHGGHESSVFLLPRRSGGREEAKDTWLQPVLLVLLKTFGVQDRFELGKTPFAVQFFPTSQESQPFRLLRCCCHRLGHFRSKYDWLWAWFHSLLVGMGGVPQRTNGACNQSIDCVKFVVNN